MRIGSFILGTVFGLAGGIAGCVEAKKKFGYPISWFTIKKNALNSLTKKMLGDEYCVKVEFVPSYIDYGEWARAREGLKNYVEKQKEEKGELVYSIMDILGTEGIFDEGYTILDKLARESSEFRRGAFEDSDEATPDEYDIRGETFYVYYLRGGDEEPGYVSAVEKRPVTVNYCGVFVTRSELDIYRVARVLDDEDWGFVEDDQGRTELTFEEYLDSKLK